MNDKRIEGEEMLTAEDYEKAGNTIAEPMPEKKPSNAGLTVALVMFNFAFFVVDVLSAFVVGYLTRWYYGVATLLAGAIFMFVHEFLFTRAFNSLTQKRIAIGGAVWAVLTILVIALLSVVANLTGFMTPDWEPYFLSLMVGVIVFNVVLHGTLTAIYYYIDEGHNAKSKAARAVARAKTQVEIDDAAETLLTKAIERRVKRKKLINRFRSPAAVRRAIEEAGGDADNDGIPDWRDPIDNRTGRPFVYAQTADRTPVPATQTGGSEFTWYDMPAFLKAMNLTEAQARARWQGKSRDEFAADVAGTLDISGKNMRKLYYQLFPTQAGSRSQ